MKCWNVRTAPYYFLDRLLNGVIEECNLCTNLDVVKNHKTSSDVRVDYQAELLKDMSVGTSGNNFLVTFPGFIVFAHAWAGYSYRVDIKTSSRFLSPTGNVLSEVTIETPYEFRYTSFARGAASSLVGWLTPGFGLLDVIPGIMFNKDYDERATPEFMDRVEGPYKRYVSSLVIA